MIKNDKITTFTKTSDNVNDINSLLYTQKILILELNNWLQKLKICKDNWLTITLYTFKMLLCKTSFEQYDEAYLQILQNKLSITLIFQLVDKLNTNSDIHEMQEDHENVTLWHHLR